VTGGAAEPRIVSETLGPPVRLELAVAPDLPCFEGHFPGVPVLPGVVQLDWAIRFGGQYLGMSSDIRRIDALKFSRIVRPGARLTLELEPTVDGFCFRYQHGAVTCSSGRIACAR